MFGRQLRNGHFCEQIKFFDFEVVNQASLGIVIAFEKQFQLFAALRLNEQRSAVFRKPSSADDFDVFIADSFDVGQVERDSAIEEVRGIVQSDKECFEAHY